MYKSFSDIQRVIEKGKPEAVIDKFVESYLHGEARRQWDADRAAEHATLFPELVDGDPILADDGVTVDGYEQIPNPDYVPFGDWLSETVVTQEALDEVIDPDTGEILVEAQPEVVELVRPYVPPESVDVAGWKVTSQEWRNYQKAKRNEEVEKIVVTTASGKQFDGDEKSQDRMNRAIVAASIMGQNETTWVTADNVPTLVTLTELQEAFALSLQAMSEKWFIQ